MDKLKRVLCLLLAWILCLSMVSIAVADPDGTEGTQEGTPVVDPHTHNYVEDPSQTTQPTCGVPGKIVLVCECSDTSEQEIPALGHDFSVLVSNTATCNAGGKKTMKCSRCEATAVTDVTATGQHRKDGGTITPATCTADGKKEYQCAVCGVAMPEATEILPKLGHDWKDAQITKKATCVAEGAKTQRCSRTGCTATQTVTIPIDKEAHNWQTENEAKVTKEPTCADKDGEGIRTFKCKNEGCSATREEKIPKLKEHKWDGGVVTTQPTCVKKGVKTYTCTVCKQKKTEDLGMTNHKWDGGKTTIEPTVTEKGLSTFTCMVCQKQQTRDIPPRGQSMSTEELTTMIADPNNAYGAKLNVEPWVVVQAVLNEEELARVQEGWPFSVTLYAKRLLGNVPESELLLFEQAVGDTLVIHSYLDITLTKQMHGDPPQQVAQSNEVLDISVKLPDDIPELKKNMKRTYCVLRAHDGTVTKLATKLSDDGESILFQTDGFSTYAIAFEDMRVAGAFDAKLILFIALGVAALGGVGFLGYKLIGGILRSDDDDEYDDYEE